MEQVGYVTSVQDGLADLEVRRVGACGASCESCHANCEEKVEHIQIINNLNAKVGDYVQLEADAKRVLSYIFLVYGLPLLGLLVGSLIGTYVFKALNVPSYELFGFFIGLVTLLASYLYISRLDRKSQLSHSPIQMVKIL